MAFVNSIAAFLSGIMQPTYFGQSIGSALSGSSNLTIPVQATTAVEVVSGSNVNYLNRGFLRLKLYNLGGTSPTFQFNVYANSATGELLYSSPTVDGIADFTALFQADESINNFYIVYVGGGTSPTGTLDFENAGTN